MMLLIASSHTPVQVWGAILFLFFTWECSSGEVKAVRPLWFVKLIAGNFPATDSFSQHETQTIWIEV